MTKPKTGSTDPFETMVRRRFAELDKGNYAVTNGKLRKATCSGTCWGCCSSSVRSEWRRWT